MRKKVISLVLVLSVATSILAGCNKSSGKTSDGGDPNAKPVKILSDIDGDYFTEYLDVFTSTHPNVKIQVEVDSTKHILDKLKEDKNNAGIDIVFGYSAIEARKLEKQGILLPYKPEGYADINDMFKSGEETPSWVGVSGYTPVIAYNKNSVDKDKLPVPKKISDLANDEYDGYFALPDLDKTPMGSLIKDIVEKEVGKDKKDSVLQKLRENSYASDMYYAKTASYLNEYKVPIAVLPDFEGLFSQWDDANMKVIYGTGDTLEGDIETVALVDKKNANPNAKVLEDWFLSTQAMNLYKKNRSMVSGKGIETVMEKAPTDLEKKVKFVSGK